MDSNFNITITSPKNIDVLTPSSEILNTKTNLDSIDYFETNRTKENKVEEPRKNPNNISNSINHSNTALNKPNYTGADNTMNMNLNTSTNNRDRSFLLKKSSDTFLLNELFLNQRDSRLNLSISRISKGGFVDSSPSKLRAVYKKQNESMLNITNIKTTENQLIKLFGNNSLYGKENDKKDNNVNKAFLKDKEPAATAKKLASNVISMYRDKVLDNYTKIEEKAEAKEILNKLISQNKLISNDIVRRQIVKNTNVETIMRSKIHKISKSSNTGRKNNMTFHSCMNSVGSKINVTQIDSASRILSPIRNFKLKTENERKSLDDELVFKPTLFKTSKYTNVQSKVIEFIKNPHANSKSSLSGNNPNYFTSSTTSNQINSIDLKIIDEREEKLDNDDQQKTKIKRPLTDGLIPNKYKTLVEEITKSTRKDKKNPKLKLIK